MDLIENIGAFLGLAAFIGLGILSLLYFQQGREVRRLRDWAGRGPERAAAAAAEAESALAPAVEEEDREPSLGQRMRARWDGWTARLPRGIGGRLPAPQYLVLILLAVVLIGVGAATNGFGLLGSDEPEKSRGPQAAPPAKVEVAVLNGTAVIEGAPGVPGLAATVADDVKELGYKLGPVADTGSPVEQSSVMYDSDQEAEAEQLAKDISKLLDKTQVEKMSGEIRDQAGDATVAIVIGQDDSQLE